MARRKAVGAAAGPDFGHGPGQTCPFCWEWFKGASLELRGWQMAPLITPEATLAEWYARYLALAVGPVPTPPGIEDYPALAALLDEHRAGRRKRARSEGAQA